MSTGRCFMYLCEDSTSHEFKCGICRNILIDPVSTQCSEGEHIFCNVCIQDCVKVTPSCPTCRDNLNLQDLIPMSDRFLINKLGDMPIQCHICQENLKQKNFTLHKNELCSKAKVDCIAANIGCRWIGLRNQLEEHLSDCQFARFNTLITGMINENQQNRRHQQEQQIQIERLTNENKILMDQSKEQDDQISNLRHHLIDHDQRSRLHYGRMEESIRQMNRPSDGIIPEDVRSGSSTNMNNLTADEHDQEKPRRKNLSSIKESAMGNMHFSGDPRFHIGGSINFDLFRGATISRDNLPNIRYHPNRDVVTDAHHGRENHVEINARDRLGILHETDCTLDISGDAEPPSDTTDVIEASVHAPGEFDLPSDVTDGTGTPAEAPTGTVGSADAQDATGQSLYTRNTANPSINVGNATDNRLNSNFNRRDQLLQWLLVNVAFSQMYPRNANDSDRDTNNSVHSARDDRFAPSIERLIHDFFWSNRRGPGSDATGSR